MSNRPRPALVHYYVDADLLGVAKILVQLRGDVTYPGDPGGPVKGGRVRAACTITDPATLDEVWIPETARPPSRDRHVFFRAVAPQHFLLLRTMYYACKYLHA